MAFGSDKILTGKLRELIKKQGYNLAEFARELGISTESLRKYAGEVAPVASIKPEFLRTIAGKLNVPLDELRPEPDVTYIRVPAGQRAILLPEAIYDRLLRFAKDEQQTPEELLVEFVAGYADTTVNETGGQSQARQKKATRGSRRLESPQHG